MARYVASIEVPGPPEPLFDYLADFSSTREWDPGVADARRLGAGALGVGSEFEVVVTVAGRRLPLRYRLIEHDRPHRIVLEATTRALRSHDEIDLLPHGMVTRVVYDATVTLRGPARLAGPLLRLGFRRVGDRAAAGLRTVLEARAAAG